MAATVCLCNRVTDIWVACDQTSEYPEREISLQARFYRTDIDRIAGWCGFDDGREHGPNRLRYMGVLLASCCQEQESRQRSDDRELALHDEPSA
jgi:hypothetical protein